MLFQKAKLGDITPTEDYSQEKSDTKSAKVQGFIRYLSYTAVFVGKGNLFCKKSYKLYLWIKQEKNSILINIRWRPKVLVYIHIFGVIRERFVICFCFVLIHTGLLIGLTMGYLLL